MALTSVPQLKSYLGIAQDDSSEDDLLQQIIRSVSREMVYHYLNADPGQFVESISKENPAKIRVLGHELSDGDKVQIFDSDSGVSVDGEHTISLVDRDHFTVPIDNSLAEEGAMGWLCRQRTEIYSGCGTKELPLRWTPILAITDVWENVSAYYGTADNPWDDAYKLTEGTDYALKPDGGMLGTASKSGLLVRLGQAWKPVWQKNAHRITLSPRDGMGNVRVRYFSGVGRIPDDLLMGVHIACGQARQEAFDLVQASGAVSSESMDGWSASYVSGTAAAAMIAVRKSAIPSASRLLSPYRKWVPAF